jgi:virginiamycin B lyase
MKRGYSFVLLVALLSGDADPATAQTVRYFELPPGSGPHDVAPAPDGTVWYTAQRTGHLGRLDPRNGKVEQIPLGRGSAPHGVIVGPDGAAWVTDSGQNAIVRVDPSTRAVKVYPLPEGTRYTNMNTAAFDGDGLLWWTGQAGYYGSVNPKTGEVRVMEAPEGRGPYGITATPKGDIYYVSLAGNHLAQIDTRTGKATVIEPPTPRQGARRVWSDSQGRLWISEWSSGQVSRYDPATQQWKAWKPSERSRCIRSTSTSVTRSGSPSGRPTRSCGSIRRPRSSRASRATVAMPRCGRCSAAPARRGARSPAPTGSW